MAPSADDDVKESPSNLGTIDQDGFEKSQHPAKREDVNMMNMPLESSNKFMLLEHVNN